MVVPAAAFDCQAIDKEVSLVLSKWPIRNKLITGLGLMLVIVGVLSWSGFYGLYSYRALLKSLERVAELPLATELGLRASDLRVAALTNPVDTTVNSSGGGAQTLLTVQIAREEFRQKLDAVRETLEKYRQQLQQSHPEGVRIGGKQQEWETVREIDATLTRIAKADQDEDWVLNRIHHGELNRQLERLQLLISELPSYLHQNIHEFPEQVRGQYRTRIVVAWVTSIATLTLVGLFFYLFYKWIFRPLRILIKGSRKVAGGNFDYTIHLKTDDEMAELAQAMNQMTARFKAIRDDLDRQVREQSRQIVQNEQLASVGFLAAGVAHEINNPLASIAMCAESLERKLHNPPVDPQAYHDVQRDYLQMIQTEAFRCKEITEKLLDFSRVGEKKRGRADLRELVQGVIDMVGHLGKYQNRAVRFEPGDPVHAAINQQEMKQVVLNLLTNALDSVDSGGQVVVELFNRRNEVELVFKDNGCGMTDEVLEHLFEPFFTRRREGQQGTGLGLSITYRIIAEHDGRIEATSEGPGKGSQFRIYLPAAPEEHRQESRHQYQAA